MTAAQLPKWAEPMLVPLYGLEDGGLCRCSERLCKTRGGHVAGHVRHLQAGQWVDRGYNLGIEPDASAGLVAIVEHIGESAATEELAGLIRSPLRYKAGTHLVVHLFTIARGDKQLLSQTLAHGVTVVAGCPRFRRMVPFPPGKLPSGDCAWLTEDWRTPPPRVNKRLADCAALGPVRPREKAEAVNRAVPSRGTAGRATRRTRRAPVRERFSAGTSFDEFVEALEANDCQVSLGGKVAQCPAHPDRIPSLSIGEAPDGTLLAFCHAGCSFTEVLKAIGLVGR